MCFSCHVLAVAPVSRPLLPVLAIALSICGIAYSDDSQPVVLESSHLKLQMREDLFGIASLTDKRNGRDYCAGEDRAFGLYTLYFGKSFSKAKQSGLSDIVSKKVATIDDGVQLTFEHRGTHPALVDCFITAKPSDPAIRFRIAVTNRSNQGLVAIDYPRLSCPPQLGDRSEDDRLLYPQHEGVLLCDPAQNMKPGAMLAKAYPGSASAQLMYFFDAAGGLYCGVEDIGGGTKTPQIKRQSKRLDITWRHEFPSDRLGRAELAYDVVVSAGGPTWQDGADIYRDWAEENAPWCEKTIRASAAPDWLQQVNVFLNYTVETEGEFANAKHVAEWFGLYREFFGVPIVACAFGWEKHGSWIGPDYFPPRGGEGYYRELTRLLAEQSGHMHVFTSGFRWGVRKTDPQTMRALQAGDRQQPRRYTNFDGSDHYANRGSGGVAIDGDGRAIFKQPPWADNYLLCAGSATARQVIADSFATIYDLGIAGVDLDQDLGAGMSHCYSRVHGHPPGAGSWQYHTMSAFLEGVRAQARQKHSDSFIGVEEPCEAYIPVIDIVHGRAFTGNVWPAAGPGAVSVPLYIYLYHPYQLNYAGWIDKGFSPFGDERVGMGRAMIFGMQLGVRIGSPPFQYDGTGLSDELTMLANAVSIQNRCRDHLILGRMLHDPVITGSTNLEPLPTKRHAALPLSWPAVQATAWRSSSGSVLYAVANLSDRPQSVKLLAQSYGVAADSVQLTRIGVNSEQTLRADTALPVRVTLELDPWEICCVEQE